MLGAKDVAFPRLNLLSLYLYWTGATHRARPACSCGGADTGWTFYAPYSTTTPMTVVPVLLGVFVLGFSSIVTGLNFIVTIHTLRAPGHRLDAAAAVRVGDLRAPASSRCWRRRCSA